MNNTIIFPKQIVFRLNLLSSFSFGRLIWRWYEPIAIAQLKKCKQKILETAKNHKNISIQNAKKELKTVDKLVEWLEKTKIYLDILKQEPLFNQFYQEFIAVYHAFLDIQLDLEDASEPHYYAQLSQSVIQDDKEEDEYWSNYRKPLTSQKQAMQNCK